MPDSLMICNEVELHVICALQPHALVVLGLYSPDTGTFSKYLKCYMSTLPHLWKYKLNGLKAVQKTNHSIVVSDSGGQVILTCGSVELIESFNMNDCEMLRQAVEQIAQKRESAGVAVSESEP